MVATVEQFNAVSYRVISTVLMTVEAKPQHRAKVIVKWIDIAQVCSTFLVLNILTRQSLGEFLFLLFELSGNFPFSTFALINF